MSVKSMEAQRPPVVRSVEVRRARERVKVNFPAKIVEVEIDGVAIYRPFVEFRRANSYCHLYGAQSHRQTYFFATMNFLGLDLTTSDRWH
ncbi:hypothetical protein TNCV_405311 [Trichonephila clavipes]|nr:hypothetical protein TNCV_405311 [Trichonephila clavipes]